MDRTSDWETVFQSRSWGQWPSLDLVRFLAGYVYAESPCALELGPGGGANLWPLALRDFTIAGVDIAPSALAQVRTKLDNAVPGWTEYPGGLVDGSVTDLPFSASRFDLIIDVECVSCLSVDEARRAYAEAFRVARPGARLFVQTFGDRTYVGDSPLLDDGRFHPTVGPLAGVPAVRLARGQGELASILGPWNIRDFNTSTRTVSQGSMLVEEFIVVSDKPS